MIITLVMVTRKLTFSSPYHYNDTY